MNNTKPNIFTWMLMLHCSFASCKVLRGVLFWVTLLAPGSCPLFIFYPFPCGFCVPVCLPVCQSVNRTLFALVAKLTAWTKFPGQPKGDFGAIRHVYMNIIWNRVAEQLRVVSKPLWTLLESVWKDCVKLRFLWEECGPVLLVHTHDIHLCMLAGQLPRDSFLNMAPSLLLSLLPSSRLSFLHDRASNSPPHPLQLL